MQQVTRTKRMTNWDILDGEAVTWTRKNEPVVVDEIFLQECIVLSIFIPSDGHANMASKATTSPKSCSTSSSTASMDDAPFCGFSLASTCPKTQFPAVPPQIHVMLINLGEVSLPATARWQKWYLLNLYYRSSTTKHGSAPTTRLKNHLKHNSPYSTLN